MGGEQALRKHRGIMNYAQLEKQFSAQLSLTHRPVAVAPLTDAPAGVEKFEGVNKLEPK